MYARVGKRWFDMVIATLAILFLSPLLLLVAIFIRLEDRGPALFRQLRVGQHRKRFTLLKFRSMPVHTEDLPSAEADKLRVTRVGRIIRRTNVDELPQLLNILRGDMSLVGPRPALPKQETLIALRAANGVFSCAPGLTGLAQIKAYDGMEDSEKASWDAIYCEQISFARDLSIIMRTFLYLLKPPPTY